MTQKNGTVAKEVPMEKVETRKAADLSGKLSLEQYLRLDYPIELVRDEEDAWVASIPDLPGCNSYGDTVSEAVDGVTKMKNLWIRGRYDSDQPIPEPTEDDDFSGRFVLRIPKALHRSLAFQAQRQSVSLNHYASHLLSERNCNYQLQHITRLLEFCTHRAEGNWQNRSHRFMWVTADLPGEMKFLGLLRKPPSEYSFKTTKKQLLGPFQGTGKSK